MTAVSWEQALRAASQISHCRLPRVPASAQSVRAEIIPAPLRSVAPRSVGEATHSDNWGTALRDSHQMFLLRSRAARPLFGFRPVGGTHAA